MALHGVPLAARDGFGKVRKHGLAGGGGGEGEDDAAELVGIGENGHASRLSHAAMAWSMMTELFIDEAAEQVGDGVAGGTIRGLPERKAAQGAGIHASAQREVERDKLQKCPRVRSENQGVDRRIPAGQHNAQDDRRRRQERRGGGECEAFLRAQPGGQVKR